MGFYDWDKIKPEELTRLSRSRMLAEVEVRRGTTTPWHSHENEELVIVLKGAWRFYLPSGELTLEANQMLSIPAGVEHSRSEEHTSELQSRLHLVCRLLLEKKKINGRRSALYSSELNPDLQIAAAR